MVLDLQKHRLLKKLEEEAEKCAHYVELIESANGESDLLNSQINRAVLRYYALLRRIEKIKIDMRGSC